MRFKTERLEIKPLRESDLDKLVLEINNINIAKYVVHIPHPYTLDDAKNYFNRSKGNELRQNIYLDNSLIGAIGLNKKDENAFEVGYWIGEKYWGNGYASEALHGMIEHLKKHYPEIKYLKADYIHGNIGSGKVLQKCGFKMIGKSEVYILSLDESFPTTLVSLKL